MSDRAEPINAILYAQWHLKGGARNTLFAMGLTLLCALIAFGVALSATPDQHRGTARGATFILLGIQWMILGFYGTSRVTAAVRADVSGGLIESHRLTPTSPLAAALGYLAGAPIQAIAVSGVMLAVGIVTAIMGDVPVIFWLAANGMTLVSCVMLWAVVGLISFSFASAAAMPIFAIISVMASSLFMLVPALAVLSAPLIGRSMFEFVARGAPSLPPAYPLSLAAQCLLTGLLWLAIARRYRNADTAAFSISLGLLLLGLWTAITMIGISQPELFLPRYSNPGNTAQLLAGIGSTTLVALAPLSAVARRLGRGVEDDDDRRARELPAWIAIVMCVVLACLPAYLDAISTPQQPLIRPLGATAAVAAMFVGVTFLLAWEQLAGRTGRAWMFLYLLLPNALPPIIDALLHANDTGPNRPYSTLIGFSPLGSLIMLWEGRPTDAIPGIVGQSVLAAATLVLYVSRKRRMGRVGPQAAT